MNRIEIPNSLPELRRINSDIYDWYLNMALPSIEQLVASHRNELSAEDPGLDLLLQDGYPWPFLLGFVIEQNSQFRVNISGQTYNLRPLRGEDMGALNMVCQSISRKKVGNKNFQITHPRTGIATAQSAPLTIQYPIEPVMKSWTYQ